MNRFFGKLAKAAMIAAVLCVVTGGALAKNLVERPFRGRGEGTNVGSCVLDFGGVPVLGALVEGWIIATHVGLSETSHCGITTGGAFPIFTLYGEGTATAANGDESYYSYTGTVDITTCLVQSTLTVTGGTGRFAGGSGLIDVVTVQPSPAPGVCGPEQASTFSGTITY